MKTKETIIIDTILPPDGGMTFEEFYQLTEDLATAGVPTEDYNEEQIGFAKLNLQRMKRHLKQVTIPEDLQEEFLQIDQPMKWVVLSEPWCMDAANLLPVMAKIAQLNPMFELRIYLRDKHPELMDRYLTNGTRSIPKMVCFSEEMDELGHWGPRPEPLIDHINDLKELAGLKGPELKAQIQVWYNKDKGQSFITELRDAALDWHEYRMPI